MPFRLLKKGKFIFSSAFAKVLEVHTSTPFKTRLFCVNFTLNPRAKISENKQLVLFSESPDVSLDEFKANISIRGKTQPTSFPRDHTLSALSYM